MKTIYKGKERFKCDECRAMIPTTGNHVTVDGLYLYGTGLGEDWEPRYYHFCNKSHFGKNWDRKYQLGIFR